MKGILVLSVHNWPAHFRPIFYRRFVNNAFLLFRTKDHVEKFKNYLNKQHKNIKFTTEIQENGSLSFLDVTITCEKNKFVISVYRKSTFSGVFINFKSFLPDIHKVGLLKLCFIEVLNYAPVTRTLWYIIVILFYVLTELGYVLSVILKRKEIVVLKKKSLVEKSESWTYLK